MVKHLGGLQGGGKSYYACYLIFNNFSDSKKAKNDLKKDYEICYTNINEFKFEKFDKVKKFRAEPFYNKIELLHHMYLDEASDAELIEKCKQLDLYKALFVIDEAQDFLEDYKKPIRWWLTYHRHLYHDILLMGVDVGQINSKYIKCINLFMMAKPPFLKFNQKTFTYSKYVKYPFSLKEAKEPGTITIPKIQDVFDLYQSGDKIEAPNIVMKFLIGGILLFILLFFGFMWFIDSKTPEQKNSVTRQHKETVTQQDRKNNNYTPKRNISNIKYYVITCTTENMCTFKNKIFPYLVFEELSKDLSYEVVYTDIKQGFIKYHLLIDSQIEDILNVKKENKNENKEVNINSVIPKF